jgi:hypothetical protein
VILVVGLGAELEIAPLIETSQKAELTAQKNKTAETERQLDALRKRVGPRSIDGPSFLKTLGQSPRALVEIVYAEEDPDAYFLALELKACSGAPSGQRRN